MKTIKIILIFILSTLILQSSTIDYYCKQKVELIKKILDNPDDYYKIIKNSNFYCDSVYVKKKYRFEPVEMYIIDNLKKFKGQCFMTYCVWDEGEDAYCLNYVGEDFEINPEISFEFYKFKDKWYLYGIRSSPPFYFFNSKSVVELFHTFYFDDGSANDKYPDLKVIRTRSIVKKSTNVILNDDYDLNNKIDFINSIINDRINLDSLLENSKFTKYNKTFFDNSDTSIRLLHVYLSRYKFRILWFNYPFPIFNEFIDEYLKNSNEKDYFIVKFTTEDNKKARYLTIEFIKNDTLWYLNRVFKGTEIYIADNHFSYIEPFKE